MEKCKFLTYCPAHDSQRKREERHIAEVEGGLEKSIHPAMVNLLKGQFFSHEIFCILKKKTSRHPKN